jgi:hypothetical protein
MIAERSRNTDAEGVSQRFESRNDIYAVSIYFLSFVDHITTINAKRKCHLAGFW